MFMQTPQIDSLKGKHTNLSLAFHTPKWSPCPSWSSSEMTFFLRYKCRIQWYFEPCARAPDSHSLQLCPLFFLTSTYQKCPSIYICWLSWYFPLRKEEAQGQLEAPRAHLRFLRSDPSRSEELLDSGRGCSSLLKICHLKWLKTIQFLATREGFGMNDAALRLCPCRLCGPQVRVLWKEELGDGIIWAWLGSVALESQLQSTEQNSAWASYETPPIVEFTPSTNPISSICTPPRAHTQTHSLSHRAFRLHFHSLKPMCLAQGIIFLCLLFLSHFS